MKYWKSIIIGVMLIGTLGFTSCSKKQAQTIDDENPPIVDTQDPIDNKEEPTKEIEYLNLNVTYTSTELETGSVEDTVDQIYDSVVAIDAYMNNQHYGSGSGVLFGYDERFSYIATCHHVIEDCQGFKIILSNDETIEAKLVGGDSESK